MNKITILNILFWILFITALVLFGYGLRNDAVKVEMTIVAMVLWAAAYGAYKWLNYEKKKA